MFIFRQSTASQIRQLGPFVDETDGKTAETALTISNTDIRISKDGGNIGAKNSGGATHDEIGYYAATFDATDTNIVGPIQIMIHEAGALPVYHDGVVLEEPVYDALYGASAPGPITAAAVNAQMADVMNTDTHAQPAQGAPAAVVSFEYMLTYLYKTARNRITSDDSEIKIYNDDAVTVDHKHAHSDDETTYDRSEAASGP